MREPTACSVVSLKPPIPTSCAVSAADIVAHTVGGLLLTLVVINKAHYLYVWYIVGVFSGSQLLAEAYTFTTVLLLGKRRW